MKKLTILSLILLLAVAVTPQVNNVALYDGTGHFPPAPAYDR